MDLATEDLPESVLYLASVIGLEAAAAIVEVRGGIKLCIPSNPGPDHWLMEIIGPSALGKLSLHFGGDEIEIPLCTAALRRARALPLFKAGASVAEVARSLGMTERAARNLKRKLKELGRL